MKRTGMIRVLLASSMAALLAWTCGCGGPSNSTPGPKVPMKTVERECAELKVPALVEQTTVYRDMIRKVMTDIKEVDDRIAKADPDVTSQDEKNKMEAERAKLDKTRVELVQRYQEYIKTLVRKGMDVEKLRLEEPKAEPFPI
jgi:hypothetical protein